MTFDEVILAVCKHNRVHTLNGTFGEVLVFLEGYSKGARLGSTGSYFGQFAEWLSKTRHYPHGQVWDRFRKSHPDDATTIAEFARLWQEYKSTLESSTHKPNLSNTR